MKMGLKIRELRKRDGLTQEQLGELVGCTKQLICNYENGTPIPADRLVAFSKLFKVDHQVFMDSEQQVQLSTQNSELVEELRSTVDFLKKQMDIMNAHYETLTDEKKHLMGLLELALKGNFQKGNMFLVTRGGNKINTREPVALKFASN